ncbi:type III toxin-antitoxin system ToxN/AbiQ family toxin [Leptotrichia trevisanii]|uniref:type III toxin-antitoxin system ToxN/AbiQ family toxin n=1 Tax=Leptotrichia trevisanii TaxID=109328 RepID=UPI0026ECC294|nr:type III toxin-antitoxin system ToxN/AbiQ family toxin [Leptotrichia trevisanii]
MKYKNYEELRLFEINDNYINYLQKFDKHILNFSGKKYKTSRKYLGILLKINDCNYFAPLSSPSKKFDYDLNGNLRKSIIPLIRMVRITNTGKQDFLGTIKLGSMIPVFNNSLMRYYDLTLESDIKYKKMVQKQLTFILKNKELILRNANKLYRQKNSNMSMGYIKNTVNFKLLEEKAKLYLHNKFTKFKKTTKNSF